MIYLLEDIDAVRKYYPNIPDDVFDTLIALDPTYRGNNSLGKYGKWILNLYNRGNLSEEEFDEVTPLLNQFTTYRNRIQNKDLNAYKTLDDLAQILASVVDDDSMLTQRQKVRFLKNVKAGRVKVAEEDDYDVVLDTQKYTVCVPNTHAASMKLGSGTRWCTAHENPDWYNSYTDGGKLYIIKDKSNGKRWQYSDKNGDFLDEDDEPFDVAKLMKSDKELSKFFEKFLGLDYYAFDGTWVYDGNEIPATLKSSITKIVIQDDIFRIEENAFAQCYSLASIEIPNSVEFIGEYAFSECTFLESVTIPNGVKSINEGTFYRCRSLKHVKLPNNLTYISSDAFWSCESLTEIEIPDSVSSIGNNVFRACYNLEFVKFPKDVDEVNEGLFKYCHKLREIDISSATYIGRSAFYECYDLAHVKLSDNIDEIGTYAFFQCESLRELIIKTDPYVGRNAFSLCNNLTIYTDSESIKNALASDVKDVKPLSAKNESISRRLRLRIKEDTCCVASKTSYMNEDGLDANGVYYFGKKPKKPDNWKDFLKTKGRRKGMKIKESYYDMEDVTYDLLETKSVYDFDGFTTDYSLYGVRMDDSDDFHYYVCVFGDRDMYDPNEGSVDFDFETEDYDEAIEWFENYTGYEYEDDDDMYESYLAEDDENAADKYGSFQMLDDLVSNFTGNMPEDDIDKAVKYLNRVTKMLTNGKNYSDVVYYGCVEGWLDPIDHKSMFKDFKQIYKKNDYDAYYATYNGKPFIVDHFDLNTDFGMYATDESVIYEIIDAISKEYE